jgi:hypothetical protein
MPHMRLDRGLADHELLRDLAVAQPAGEQLEHLPLAHGERVARPRLERRDRRLGAEHRLDEVGRRHVLEQVPAAPTRSAARRSNSSSETVRISTRASGTRARIAAHASIPSTPGMPRSSSTTSGSSRTASSTASRPSHARPATSRRGSAASSAAVPSRMRRWSSAINTRSTSVLVSLTS